MFGVGSTLHHKGARFGWVEVGEGDCGAGVGEAGDEGTDIFGEAGALKFGVKVTQPGVDEAAIAAAIGAGPMPIINCSRPSTGPLAGSLSS